MGHSLAEHLRFAILGVGVDQIPVAGDAGKVDNVGFGDGAPDTFDLIADFKFIKIEANRFG